MPSPSRSELPPGPSRPRVAQMLRYGMDPHGFFAAVHRSHGDVVTAFGSLRRLLRPLVLDELPRGVRLRPTAAISERIGRRGIVLVPRRDGPLVKTSSPDHHEERRTTCATC